MSEAADHSAGALPTAVGLGDLIGLVRRQIFLIGGVTLAMTLVAALALSTVAPRYSSKALLMINESAPNPLNLEMMISGMTGDPETVMSEIQILKSTRLAGKVIEEMALDQLPEFNPWRRAPGLLQRLFGGNANNAAAATPNAGAERVQVIRTFLDRLSVEPLPGSRVVTVEFSSRDANIAADVANRLSELYLRDQLESKFEAVQRASAWLNDRVSSLRAKVQESERQVEEFRDQSGLLEGGGTTLTDQQVSQLNFEVLDATQIRVAAQIQLDQLRKVIASEDGAATIDQVLDSPLIQRLREQQVGLLRQVAELSTEYGERHPRMVKLRADAADLETTIDGEVAKIVAGLENGLLAARGRERAARAALEAAKLRVSDNNQDLVTLRSLQREAEANRLLLETMLARFTETSAQDDLASQRPDARIIAEALIPVEPSYPMKKAILALTFVSAAFLGLMLAFMRELTDDAVRSGEQLTAAGGLHSLGLVPRIPRRGLHRQSPVQYLRENPLSAYSEAIRGIFAWLASGEAAGESRSLLVTSAQAHDGKSTLAASLALTVAAAGKRVILIDADCRNASIGRMLEIDVAHGLSDVLDKRVALDKAIATDPSGAHVLCAGDTPANPPALFASAAFGTLVRSLKSHYQYVIVDSPPTMAVSDALVLARALDSTLIVARWGVTRRESVALAARQLSEAGASIAGAVLGMVDARKYSRYAYGDSGAYTGKLKSYYHDG